MNRLERLLLGALLEYVEAYGATERAKEAMGQIGKREFDQHMSRLNAKQKAASKQ